MSHQILKEMNNNASQVKNVSISPVAYLLADLDDYLNANEPVFCSEKFNRNKTARISIRRLIT